MQCTVERLRGEASSRKIGWLPRTPVLAGNSDTAETAFAYHESENQTQMVETVEVVWHCAESEEIQTLGNDVDLQGL